MSIQMISNEALVDVSGGTTLCRLGVAAAGAGVGAVIGSAGFTNPLGAGSSVFAGGANVANELAKGNRFAALVDTAIAGATMIPGPVGAVAGAYTHGRAWYNASEALCGK